MPVWKYVFSWVIQLPPDPRKQWNRKQFCYTGSQAWFESMFCVRHKSVFVILILVSGWQKQQLEHLFSNVTLISLHSIFYILLSDMIIFSVFKPWCCFLNFSVSSMPLNYDALCTISCHHICFLINSSKKRRGIGTCLFFTPLCSVLISVVMQSSCDSPLCSHHWCFVTQLINLPHIKSQTLVPHLLNFYLVIIFVLQIVTNVA